MCTASPVERLIFGESREPCNKHLRSHSYWGITAADHSYRCPLRSRYLNRADYLLVRSRRTVQSNL